MPDQQGLDIIKANVDSLNREFEAFKRDFKSFSDPRFNPFTQEIFNQSIFLPVSITLPSSDPATAANYSIFFIADRSYEIISVTEVHGTACSSSGTLQIEKCSPGTAPDSGTALLSSALALNTTADTPQYGVIVKSTASLKRGDRLVLKDVGTLTSTANLSVTVLLRRV